MVLCGVHSGWGELISERAKIGGWWARWHRGLRGFLDFVGFVISIELALRIM
jgi:hypothetical protein